MKGFCLVVLAVMLMGCAPAALGPDFPEQVVGPENHLLVLDGVS